MLSEYAFIAMNRFLYGADETSLRALSGDKSHGQVKQWLISQLSAYELPVVNWSSKQAITAYYEYNQAKKSKQANSMLANSPSPEQPNYKTSYKKLANRAITLAEHTALHNINHKQALQARLLDFFSNHFSVSQQNQAMRLLAPTLEVEAIAPNLHQTFADMLKAVIQHPAMLLYLNNEKSTGPNSRVAIKQKGQKGQKKQNKASRSLNENLAREILELHTLGVDAGYSQEDVIELAKAISGWSIGNVKRREAPGFLFRAFSHEPGKRHVLGKAYPERKYKAGAQQGLSVLDDLAMHPNTAKHISFKLAKHFVSDHPSQPMVEAMTRAWLKSNGHIPSVMTALINHEDSWSSAAQKFKSPREFVVSTMRATNISKLKPELHRTLTILGQGFFNAGSPAGYGDEQNTWLGSGALNSRIEWANHFAGSATKRGAKSVDVLALANRVLGPLLHDDTLQALKRAESKQQALALFLMSPEFQRR